MKRQKKKAPFVIHEKHIEAARIFAEGGYFTLQEVADRVGVSRVTLWRWWQRREFREYCDRIRRQEVAKIKREIRKQSRQEARELQKKEEAIKRAEKGNSARELENWLKQENAPPEMIKEALKGM